MSRKFRLNAAVNVFFSITLAALLCAVIAMIVTLFQPFVGDWGNVFEGLAWVIGLTGLGVGACVAGCEADKRLELLDGRRKEETIWDRWDAIITEGGHDSVLKQFPESFARIFTSAGQPCPSPRVAAHPELHDWYSYREIVSGIKTGSGYRCRVTGCAAETKNSTFAGSQKFEVREFERELQDEVMWKQCAALRVERARDRAERKEAIVSGADPVVAEVVQFGQKNPVRQITLSEIGYQTAEMNEAMAEFQRAVALGGHIGTREQARYYR